MVEVRLATPQDAGSLTKIAFAAKRHWGYPEEWIDLWEQDLTVDAAYIRQNPVYVAEFGTEKAGFASLATNGDETELEHMWVLPAHMGCGVGRALVDRSIEHCRSRGIGTMLIASDPNAAGFYRKLGAIYHGQTDSVPAPRRLPVFRLEIETSNS